MRTSRVLALALALPLLAAGGLAAQQDRPGVDVSFHGTILLNGFYTSARTNNSDLPQFAVPETAADSFPTDGIGGTLRQTRVMVRAFLPELGGAEWRAELDADFFGGQQPSNGGRTFPLLRIRRAWLEGQWNRFSMLIGQEAPPIVELNPVTTSSFGLSALSSSGNLWLWIPQIRFTGDVVQGKSARVQLEGAVLAPTGYTPQPPFATDFDRAEQTKRPYLQGRLRVRWGSGETAGEVSAGGHYGWLSTAGDTTLASKAVAALLLLPLGKHLELRGEAFSGEGIAGLGGGSIGQVFGLGGRTIRTKGGWGQVNIRPTPEWTLGGSFGMDDPKDADLDTTVQRLKNVTWGGHVHWRPAPLLFGLEVRQAKTTYGAGVGELKATHVNVAAGFEF